MNRIFIALRRLIAYLAVPDAPVDPVAAMSPREYADLPVHHPLLDN